MNAYTVQKLSVQKIANQYGIPTSRVDKILKAHNVHKRSLKESHKLSVDSTFFSVIDSEEKAYWLGFMYADGYITKHKNRLTMGLNLHESDSSHVELFKKALQSQHKIGHYLNTTGYAGSAGSPYCAIHIVDDQLVNDLQNKGVVFRKSRILTFPSNDIVPDALIHHFIRGYFDGDGSVYGSAKAPCVSFDGTESFISMLLEKLRDPIKTKSRIYKDHSIYCIKLGGKNIINNLYRYMYKDATVFLGRKKHKFEEILA